MNVVCTRVGRGNPSVARYEYDGMSGGHRPLVSYDHSGIPVFHNQNLFCVIVFMKRNGLSSRQNLRENKEIFCVSVFPVELNDERHTAQRTRAVEKLLAVTLLQNQWLGGNNVSVRGLGRVRGGMIFGAHRNCRCRQHKSEYENTLPHDNPPFHFFKLWLQRF